MQPLITPIMDPITLNIFYFFVPNRIVWSHWKEFMGENTKGHWYNQTEYNVPHILFDETHCPTFGSIVDYFGAPIPSENEYLTYSMNQLPIRGYLSIFNEWFRDENLQDPVLIDYGDDDVYFDGTSTYGGELLPVNKFHDLFTSTLPDSQKGPDVFIPLNDKAPVFASNDYHDNKEAPIHFDFENSVTSSQVLNTGATSGKLRGTQFTGITTGQDGGYAYPDNLYADLSQSSATTINALRLALATQSFYEKSARGGSRYREILKSHFGVTSPDGRMQIPELLYCKDLKINVNQVIQQSESTESSPLGTQGAFALTADTDYAFTKSFTEHGMVIGVMCARYKHSYQQGLDKRFSRRTMFDYYFPVFANLGEQPIYNKEIYVGSDNTVNNEVFGYQEAFADYRYHPHYVTGEMRSNHPNSLDVWHLADWYDSKPSLSADWIKEDKVNLDRVLTVSSSVSNQMWADIYIQNTAVRVMPMFSIPGLPRVL